MFGQCGILIKCFLKVWVMLVCEKLGMGQGFDQDGKLVPLTVLKLVPGNLLNVNQEGRTAMVAVAGGQKVGKAQAGQAKKIADKAKQSYCWYYQVDLPADAEVEMGDDYLKLWQEEVSKIDVQGISKGKGFAGTVKRHKFGRGPTTHGHDHHRQPGSIGACAYPGRVFKGKRMAGQMGAKRATVRGLRIHSFDQDSGLISVVGAVPGAKKSMVKIRPVL